MSERLLLRPREAAELLAISESEVYTLCRRGRLPCVHLGRSVRVPRASLEDWLVQHTRLPGAEPPQMPTRVGPTKRAVE